MTEPQKTELITVHELLERCAHLLSEGWRLVQIGCTGLPDGNELNYTFDRDYTFYNLRLIAAPGEEVPSIQALYSCAFLYENEIAELFGVTVTEMAVDFNGKLYKIAVPTPFSEVTGTEQEAD